MAKFSFFIFLVLNFSLFQTKSLNTNENVENTTDFVNGTFLSPPSNKLGIYRMYDYITHTIAYKDLITKYCYLERMQGQAFWETKSRVLLVSARKLTRGEILKLGGKRIAQFCFGWPTLLLQQPMYEDLAINRRKRSNSHYFVGRNGNGRGQSQSQYLNFGSTNEPGKAEAESTNGGSKAVVSGSSGMGQAQSQSNPLSCEDCYGGPGSKYSSQASDLYAPGSTSGNIPGQTFFGRQVLGPGQISQGFQPELGSISSPGQQAYGRTTGVGAPSTIPSGSQTGQTPSRDYGRPDDQVRIPGQVGIPQQGYRPSTQTVPGQQFGIPGQTLESGTYTPGGQIPGHRGTPGQYLPGTSPPTQGITPGQGRPGQQIVSPGQSGGGPFIPISGASETLGQYPSGAGIPGSRTSIPGQIATSQPGPEQQRISQSGQFGTPGSNVYQPGGISSQPGQAGTGQTPTNLQGSIQGKPVSQNGYHQPGYTPQGTAYIPGHPAPTGTSPDYTGQRPTYQSQHPGYKPGQAGSVSYRPGQSDTSAQVPISVSHRPGYIPGTPDANIEGVPQRGTPDQIPQTLPGQGYTHPGYSPGGSLTSQGQPEQGSYYRPGGTLQRPSSLPDQPIIHYPGDQTVQTDQSGSLASQGSHIPVGPLRPGQAHDGSFSGQITGNYQSNVGHAGEFSGIFNGKYNGRQYVDRGQLGQAGIQQEGGSPGQIVTTGTQQGQYGRVPAYPGSTTGSIRQPEQGGLTQGYGQHGQIGSQGAEQYTYNQGGQGSDATLYDGGQQLQRQPGLQISSGSERPSGYNQVGQPGYINGQDQGRTPHDINQGRQQGYDYPGVSSGVQQGPGAGQSTGYDRTGYSGSSQPSTTGGTAHGQNGFTSPQNGYLQPGVHTGQQGYGGIVPEQGNVQSGGTTQQFGQSTGQPTGYENQQTGYGPAQISQTSAKQPATSYESDQTGYPPSTGGGFQQGYGNGESGHGVGHPGYGSGQQVQGGPIGQGLPTGSQVPGYQTGQPGLGGGAAPSQTGQGGVEQVGYRPGGPPRYDSGQQVQGGQTEQGLLPGYQTGQTGLSGGKVPSQRGQGGVGQVGYRPVGQPGYDIGQQVQGGQTGQGLPTGSQLPGYQTGPTGLNGGITPSQIGQGGGEQVGYRPGQGGVGQVGYRPAGQAGYDYGGQQVQGGQTGQGLSTGSQAPGYQTGQTGLSGGAAPSQTGYENIPGSYTQPGQIGGPGGDGRLGHISGVADDSDSQAQTSIQQVTNGTQASASSQGKYEGGTAQSQVSGTYSGGGSFSASAGSNDGKRGAQTQITGNKEGAISSAQGNGGKGQSQAQVQLSADTGDTQSSAQSGGINHSTNTQVQAGGKGGMADAQANGPGSTSSQAQIGFTPYNENEPDDQNVPFGGGGTASAQSGTYAGQSQSQIQGKYKYGIKYSGNSQASSGNDGNFQKRPLPTMKPFVFATQRSTLSQGNEENTDQNVNKQPVIHEKTQNNQDENGEPISKQQTRSSTIENIAGIDDAKILKIVTTSTTPVPSINEDYSEEYDEYEEQVNKHEQHARTQRQHIILGPVEDLEATNTRTEQTLLKFGDVINPGQKIPGTPGYQIPAGFRGRVASGQTTSGFRSYDKPIYATGANTNLKNGGVGYGSGYTYQPVQYPVNIGKTYPKFVSVSKSETGSKNLHTGKKTPSVYYTQSSSCGYFTNTCFYSNGQKICMPKPRINPDGSRIRC